MYTKATTLKKHNVRIRILTFLVIIKVEMAFHLKCSWIDHRLISSRLTWTLLMLLLLFSY